MEYKNENTNTANINKKNINSDIKSKTTNYSDNENKSYDKEAATKSFNNKYNITKADDIETFKGDLMQKNSLHVDLQKSGDISEDNWNLIFNQLAVGPKNEFSLDLSNLNMDEGKIASFANCMQNWNLKKFNLHLAEAKLNDNQFQSLICESIKHMSNLESLDLNLENVEMTQDRRKCLENTINTLPNLKHLSVNIKSKDGNISDVDINDFKKAMHKFKHDFFYF